MFISYICCNVKIIHKVYEMYDFISGLEWRQNAGWRDICSATTGNINDILPITPISTDNRNTEYLYTLKLGKR